ncbi:metallophosphoesterase family protein [Roseomonas terrae]|jgi:diadenosine tetraphosphatase ApaH/serine/threonine PP2A family protein phosphatase|uniref:Metallophosphoesterase family protein n=1 Tax=Neoroseomonas terrae TaxID=424799 RepID=A0ABS5EPT9_9PROT|nr:metallophosphoesterase family protein [Neoroseomonas terrae]MBR0653017.1 metallophosphoesterase family protein [Neoroseomonas terrae]
MRIAVLSDVHANLEAFRACLDNARLRGAERIVLLGDLVGYGADPVAVLELAMEEVSRGAVAILGNHDEAAAFDGPTGMNDIAALAIAWTRRRLGPAHRAFIAGLPLTHEEEGRLYVHAEASAPARWRYVTDAEAARRSMEAVAAHITVCGHVHKPALYSLGDTGKLTGFRPVAGAPVPLGRGRHWLAVVGAVGQPRDGDPSACYLMIETTPLQATWLRVPYDVAAAAEKIRAAGLPAALAERLFVGR